MCEQSTRSGLSCPWKTSEKYFFPSNVKVTSFKIGQGMDFGNSLRCGGKVREVENRCDSLFEPKGKE